MGTVCAGPERALPNTPADPRCSKGDGGTKCCLILSQGPLSPFFYVGWPNESSRCFGTDSLFQLTRSEIRSVQILKGLRPIPPPQQEGMAEVIAVGFSVMAPLCPLF